MNQVEFAWTEQTGITDASRTLSREELSAAADAALELLPVDAINLNTKRNYTTAIRYFGAWYALRFASRLLAPFSTNVVLKFLGDHLSITASMEDASIDDFALHPPRTYALPQQVEDQLVKGGFKRVPGPMSEAQLRAMLAALVRGRRNSNRFPKRPDSRYFSRDDLVSRTEFRDLLDARTPPARSPQNPYTQLTPDLFASLVATCNVAPRGLRDRALLYFGWSGGGLNSHEIASARIADFRDDGFGIQYTCRFSAAASWGLRLTGLTRTYRESAADSIRAWIAYLAGVGIRDGAMWRTFHRNHTIRGAMASACIREIVREHAKAAGLSPHQFSARSLTHNEVVASLSGVPWTVGSAELRVRQIPYSTFRALVKRRGYTT